jgi:hypothetical protein
MQTPYRFANRAGVISVLRQYPWEAWFQLERWRERNGNLEAIIRRAVGGNTFRAFHHTPHPPARTFRTWALKALAGSRLKSLESVASQSEYTAWLYELSDDFCRFWKQEMRVGIPFGPSLKLPNLLAKRLSLYSGIREETFRRLVRYLEVPLDSYTIQAVANCVASFPDANTIGQIPLTATMNFVKDLPMYEAFQRGIRQLAEGAGVPAIALDCLVWDAGHDHGAPASAVASA